MSDTLNFKKKKNSLNVQYGISDSQRHGVPYLVIERIDGLWHRYAS